MEKISFDRVLRITDRFAGLRSHLDRTLTGYDLYLVDFELPGDLAAMFEAGTTFEDEVWMTFHNQERNELMYLIIKKSETL